MSAEPDSSALRVIDMHIERVRKQMDRERFAYAGKVRATRNQ